jgi:hypothetical protein
VSPRGGGRKRRVGYPELKAGRHIADPAAAVPLFHAARCALRQLIVVALVNSGARQPALG